MMCPLFPEGAYRQVKTTTMMSGMGLPFLSLRGSIQDLYTAKVEAALNYLQHHADSAPSVPAQTLPPRIE
ncbi:MAG TPA: hypothetical protein VHP11_06020 [Tepidisphaeraceae bacterium]|nr:hypothetical protein [Tepidisphaeraceae bacterium]